MLMGTVQLYRVNSAWFGVDSTCVWPWLLQQLAQKHYACKLVLEARRLARAVEVTSTSMASHRRDEFFQNLTDFFTLPDLNYLTSIQHKQIMYFYFLKSLDDLT